MLTVKERLIAFAESIDPERWKNRDIWRINLQDIGMDSMKYIQFIVAIEQHLDIELPDELLDFSNYQTLEEIGTYIESLHKN